MNNTNPHNWEIVPENIYYDTLHLCKDLKNEGSIYPCLFITNKKQMIIMPEEVIISLKEKCKYLYDYHINNIIDNEFSIIIDENIENAELHLLQDMIYAVFDDFKIMMNTKSINDQTLHMIEKYDLKKIVEEHICDEEEEYRSFYDNDNDNDYDNDYDYDYDREDDFLMLPGHNSRGFSLRGCEGDFD